MILDLEKIKKLEKKYQNDPITLSAFQRMVTLAAESFGMSDILHGENPIAIATLKDLGCFKEPTKPIEQINS